MPSREWRHDALRIAVVVGVSLALLVRGNGVTHAQSGVLTKEQLDTLERATTLVCGKFVTEGSSQTFVLDGQAKAQLASILRKLGDLSLGGGANLNVDEYSGVLRNQLAPELKDIRDCRRRIWDDLIAKFFPGERRTENPQPSVPRTPTGNASRPDTERDRFGPEALRLVAKGIAVKSRGFALATFELENRSGVGIDAALDANSITLGTCSRIGIPDVAGVGLARPSGQREWQSIPASRKITFSMGVICAELASEKSVDFAASLLVRVGEQIFSYPVQADGVPVKVTDGR